MTARLTPRPGILDIALYKGGASAVPGQAQVIKLSSNENPFGAPEAARDAAARAMHDLHRYPATDHAALRAALAQAHGLEADRITCGNGSGDLLSLLVQAYAGPGDEIVFPEHGFSMYPIYAHSIGATPVPVPERDRTVDVDAILAAITPRSRVVLLANPANPTGTMIPAEDLTRLADGLPGDVLLVLDGAYAEFVDGYDGGASLVRARHNVVMSRTFSKIYGIAALRVGWIYGPQDVIDVVNRIRGPFNLTSPALAGAQAALEDTEFLTRMRNENARLRDWLTQALRDHGLGVDTSYGNFILARFADSDQAAACDAHLRAAGIIVRPVAGYGLPNALRITIGDEPACRQVAHLIGTFLAGAS